MYSNFRFVVIMIFGALALLVFPVIGMSDTRDEDAEKQAQEEKAPSRILQSYSYPEFYRGIYLNNSRAASSVRFARFLKAVKGTPINTFVMDVQTARYVKHMVPASHVKRCLERGIHPVARVVVFPEGIKKYPPPKGHVEGIVAIAKEACKQGFKEIQFDYIRFSDENRYQPGLRHVSYGARYRYVEGFLTKARAVLRKYKVRMSADVFGRIPHRKKDRIGQRMEGLDRVVDLICPMAYPSHYWTRRQMYNPYYTVKWTSAAAAKRTTRAGVVTWIQAFRWRMPRRMSFEKYVREQIRAVHDAGVGGFIMWNARQRYALPLKAVASYYRDEAKRIAEREKRRDMIDD